MTPTRRWNSFVCPGCRFVFRVPRDHDGHGVVCPACRVMLRLPGPDDDVPPLVMVESAEPPPVEWEDHDGGEDEDGGVPESHGDRNFILGLCAGGLLLLGVFWWWMKPVPQTPLAAPAAGQGPVEPGPEPEPAATLMMRLEAAAKGFLDAPTAEDALKWVRDPGDVAAKLEARRAGQDYQPPGFREIFDHSVVATTKDGPIYSAHVRTADYDVREMVFVPQNGELKVDWESWVGWSEMSWSDFMDRKPVEPHLFRVILSRVDYYNFGFKDDSEWTSYRLDSPDGSEVLYGYVPRTGELDQRIRPVEAKEKVKLLLNLKFPPDGSSRNQVLIDGVTGEGWIELEDDK